MAITFDVQPGYQFSASERVTYSKLNLLGTPGITLDGLVDSSEITDGAVTTQKLASSIDINSKIDDHNLALSKLAQGTHGQILYYDANSDLVTLPPGTDGYFLRTKGAGADPEWASQAGLGSVPYTDITTDGNDKYLTTDSSGNIEWIDKPVTISQHTFYTSDNAEDIRAGTGFEEVSIVDGTGTAYTPEHLRVTLYCETSDAATGYDAGDELELGHNFWSAYSQNRNAVLVIYDAASQKVRIQFEYHVIASRGSGLRIQNKTTGDDVEVNYGAAVSGKAFLGNFKFKVRAWKSGFASSGTNAGPLTSDPGYYFSGLSSGTAGDYIFGTTAASRQVVFNHGLGSVPKLVRSVFVATSDISELGLVSGQEIDTSNLIGSFSSSEWHLVQTVSTTSQVRLNVQLGNVGQVPSPVWLGNNSTNKLTALTSDMMSKMKFKLYAWK
jgi:hypothetical protein